MAESKIKGKEAIASIEFNLSSSDGWSASQAYPTGFNDSNCNIIGFEVFMNSAWRTGQGIAQASNVRLFVELNSSDGVRAYNNISELHGAKVRVTLLRLPS